MNDGIKVFDVTVESISDAGQAGKFRNILENMLGSHELYLASNSDHRVYSFAKSINPTKWISEIDLSGCTDVTVYDRLRLVPLFNTENPPKKFRVNDFVEKIIRKHGWSYDYRNEMIEAFNDIVVPAFTPLIAFDPDWETKVFRDVTIEKIERDIVDLNDPRGAFKNPEWKSWAETRLVGGLHHKNHIWDNPTGNSYHVYGFRNPPRELYDSLTDALAKNHNE